jgi:hypothetical protein
MGLTLLVPDRASPSPVMYLAYVNRSRLDLFGGLFGGVARRLLSAKAKGTVGDQFTRLRKTLERDFAARHPSPS